MLTSIINGLPLNLLTTETNEDISDENVEPAVGPPTKNPSEDTVYDEFPEMS